MTAIRKTVLHDWHAAHGGKMVDFSGWDMPVQYPTGAIAEHLATRRRAGLFDVSHMGRYVIAGPQAEAFAMRALTNNARALKPDEAHYTFIANEEGGALDDAYLYRLAPDRFLLVVNAGNRDKDWSWLQDLKRDFACSLEDESEALSMVSLQGPDSAAILEEILGGMVLPENKRNRLSRATFQGHEVILSRTGYTGEAVCFELFVPREATVAFWQALVDEGAVPAGLGARDSLRLEAGLPLYGHELGLDPDGREIPIFANGLAGAGVRLGGNGNAAYVGQAALERQREELAAIRRHEIGVPVEERVLQRLVLPIAVFGSKKPLRAGFKVRMNGTEVGVVTSGTTVPSTQFVGEGLTATPGEGHELRPIGLALLSSDLHYRADRPVVVEVVDARGKAVEAELVKRNLWPTAPYTRAYGGFEAPKRIATVAGVDLAEAAAALARESERNTAASARSTPATVVILLGASKPP